MDINSAIERFKNGELRWSVKTCEVEKILPLIRRLAGLNYYTRTARSGKYTHFYTKSIPHWEIRNSDIRKLRKLEKSLYREELLKQREELEAKLSSL